MTYLVTGAFHGHLDAPRSAGLFEERHELHEEAVVVEPHHPEGEFRSGDATRSASSFEESIVCALLL